MSGENAPRFFRLEKFLPLIRIAYRSNRSKNRASHVLSLSPPSLSIRPSVRRSSIAGGYPVNHVASSPLNFGFDAIGPLLAI